MIRVITELEPDTFCHLMDLASDERRSTRDQARWLLERAIAEIRERARPAGDATMVPSREYPGAAR